MRVGVSVPASVFATLDRLGIPLPLPLAPQIALLGRRAAARGEAGPPHALEPIYVRRPDAEIERERLGRRSPEGDRGRT